MIFSQREGFLPPKDSFQVDSLDEDTRVSIWNAVQEAFFPDLGKTLYLNRSPKELFLLKALYRDFFKYPVDDIPYKYTEAANFIKNYLIIYTTPFFKVYDLVEFLLFIFPNPIDNLSFINRINFVLERERTGYRIVNRLVSKITSKIEIDEMENAIIKTKDKFEPVSIHLNNAQRLLSDRKDPDYKNSIKESLCAVESMVNIINGNKTTLGKGLKKIKGIHPSLNEGFIKLYGYGSEEEGIRHGMLDQKDVTFDEAKYMIVQCSAFINFLKSKISKGDVYTQ